MPRPRRLVILTGALTLLASLTLVYGGVLVGRATAGSARATASQASSAVVNTSSGTDATDDPGDLSSVIARAMDSVVVVRTTATRPGIFGNSVQVQGQGSGVIVADGVVVTNAHVVDGATSVAVSFGDRSDRVAATVLSTDAVHDVAVLGVDTGDHPAIRMGTSADLRLGDTVVALGYPLGLGPTATSGIVSGLDRNVAVGNGTG
ncbi:MAG TPA: trypsin-like peptidase domain-containing protein, partial [Actinomycetota bacterium]|nr:trypsin-like peptidase domain-containing protein [Actinomycetota bacterium]